MDPAQPAGGEHADSGGRGDRAGARDGGGAVGAGRGGHRQITYRELRDVVGGGQPLQRGVVESDTRIWPSSMPIVAGTAPLSRTVCSISRATFRLSGRGRPCEMIVLSSATSGRTRRSRRGHLVAEANGVTIRGRFHDPDATGSRCLGWPVGRIPE